VFIEGKVGTPDGTGLALRALSDAGFFVPLFPTDSGGLGAP
jgi:hypothetical protein